MTLLFLNSLGTGEVVLILFVVLLLFGSKGIPDVVKNLGRGMNQIRDASNEIKKDIQRSALEMRKDLKIDETMDDIAATAKKAIDEPDLSDNPTQTKKENQIDLDPPADEEQAGKSA